MAARDTLIDVHCHLLHGIDDGPADLDASVELARAQLDAGVGRVVATPHVSPAFPNQPEVIESRLGELQARLAEEGLGLRVDSGAEVAITAALRLPDETLQALTLNKGDWLLLEPSSSVDATGLQSMALDVQRRGFRILIAHPERVSAFQRAPAVLESMARGGVRLQVTAAALTGQFGRSTARFARDLVGEGLAHVVASDAHGSFGRGPGLEEELSRAGMADMVSDLCIEAPLEVIGP